jgi:hypothetical protein
MSSQGQDDFNEAISEYREHSRLQIKGIIETADEIKYQLNNLLEEVENIKRFIKQIDEI